jgi:hypothetical protein
MQSIQFNLQQIIRYLTLPQLLLDFQTKLQQLKTIPNATSLQAIKAKTYVLLKIAI